MRTRRDTTLGRLARGALTLGLAATLAGGFVGCGDNGNDDFFDNLNDNDDNDDNDNNSNDNNSNDNDSNDDNVSLTPRATVTPAGPATRSASPAASSSSATTPSSDDTDPTPSSDDTGPTPSGDDTGPTPSSSPSP